MKKKLLALFLTLCMALSLLPATALATGGAVAEVNNTSYTDMMAALIAAQEAAQAGQTVSIKLLADVTGTTDAGIELPAGMDATLDLNGHALIGQNSGPWLINRGTLTIEDKSQMGTGRIYTTNTEAQGRAAVTNYGTLIITSGWFGDQNTDKTDTNNVQRGNALRNYGTATITGGHFTACDNYTNGGYAYAIANGGAGYPDAALTIKDADVYGSINGLIASDSGKLTVENGTYVLGDGTENNLFRIAYTSGDGQIDITGGTYTRNVNNNYGFFGGGNSGTNFGPINVSGGTFTDSVNGTIYVDSGTTNISGGTFESPVSAAENEQTTLTVSGGTFTGAVDKKYLAEGYFQDSDNTVVKLDATNAEAEIDGKYYATLPEAIAAAQTGDTVTLLKSNETACAETITITANITLDFGGKTFTSSNLIAFSVNAGKTFTVKNGTLDHKVSSGTAISVNDDCTVTVERDMTVIAGQDGIVTAENSTANVVVYGTVNAGRVAVFGRGSKSTFVLDGATITSTLWGVYQNGSYGGNTYTIRNSTLTDNYSNGAAVYISNSKKNAGNSDQGMQTLTVENSRLTGNTGIETKYTNVTIKGTGNVITSTTATPTILPSNNGSVALGYALIASHNGKDASGDSACGTLAVEGGSFTGPVAIQQQIGDGNPNNVSISISGGTFSTDVSKYCVTGMMAVKAQDGNTYAVQKIPQAVTDVVEEADVDSSATAGETSSTVSGSVPNAEKEEVSNAVSGIKVTDTSSETLTSAAKEEALPKDTVAVEKEAAIKALLTAGKAEFQNEDGTTKLVLTEAGEGANTIVIERETYLDVTVNSYDPGTGGNSSAILEMDITPKYDVYVVIQPEEEIEVSDEGYREKILAGQDMKVGETEVTVPLPTSMTITTPYVKHEISKGKFQFYSARMASSENSSKTVTFTTKGFSPITVGESAATIGESDELVGYPTLQDAVNNVKNGGTITLLANGEATVSRTVSFTVVSETDKDYTATLKAGTNYTMTVDEEKGTYTFTYAAPSVSTYAITVEDTADGAVTVSAQTATQGSVITVTAKADEGYALKSLAVTDSRGNEVALTDKGDGVYTFVMPASNVAVKAAFAAEKCDGGEGCPSQGYTDVDTSRWYHEAVDYVIEKGIMSGYGEGIFAPNDTFNRAMMVQVLYSLEGRPTVSSAGSFTDVNPNAWYAEAVAWASGNGIAKGYGERFGPDDPVTRQQVAQFLYSYAQFKGYDLSATADLSAFVDGSATSSWAEAAMKWAVGNDIISGRGNGVLSPAGTATRAEVAQMLMNFGTAMAAK